MSVIIFGDCSEAIRYCFMDCIRSRLERFTERWNMHNIRKSSNSEVHGKPVVLYTMGKLTACMHVTKFLESCIWTKIILDPGRVMLGQN